MRRVSMVGCVVASALSCLSAPAPAQNSIAERNARAAGANIGEAPAAYHDARMVMARDTTPLNLCGTVYRSLAVPLLTTGTTRVEEVVGSARREPCDPQQGPSPGAPRVAIDSVT